MTSVRRTYSRMALALSHSRASGELRASQSPSNLMKRSFTFSGKCQDAKYSDRRSASVKDFLLSKGWPARQNKPPVNVPKG